MRSFIFYTHLHISIQCLCDIIKFTQKYVNGNIAIVSCRYYASSIVVVQMYKSTCVFVFHYINL